MESLPILFLLQNINPYEKNHRPFFIFLNTTWMKLKKAKFKSVTSTGPATLVRYQPIIDSDAFVISTKLKNIIKIGSELYAQHHIPLQCLTQIPESPSVSHG